MFKKLLSVKSMQQTFLLGILLVLILVMSLLSPYFLTVVNVTNLLRQVAMVAIAAVGATFIMITRGLDISVGGLLAFTGVAFALFTVAGAPLLIATLLSIGVGAGVGMVNGALIVGAKINPVIATLGTMYMTRGLAFLVSGGTAVVNGLPGNFNVVGRGYVWVVPIPVIIMGVVFIVGHLLLSKTLLGKYTYAIGGNPETARLSGISVKKITFSLYVMAGALTGLSGAIMASRLATGNPTVGQGFEFDVIIAVLLGGTSLSGGEGTIVGTLIGTLIVGVLANGLNLLGVHTFYQYIIKGLVLVFAVMLDMGLKGQGITFAGLVPRRRDQLRNGRSKAA